ncbi:SulP family inorganic anion transporter [Pseudoalteromonas agarivorans]|uniref:SulP family inorganic anion transporter n=1 Tax=Pseudoalteromonas agarivorans TaxID=176102 RepID=UPI001F090C0C|nr:SulP family inorganic anion transporter [Pseudoalteromonas agarivorans]
MFDLISKRSANLKNDVLAGLTAVLTLIPEAVAFTFVAGIDSMMGLYGSFFVGFITAVFGGRPGMISGAAGSMAVVTTAFIIMFGLEYLLAAVVLQKAGDLVEVNIVEDPKYPLANDAMA